MTLYTKRWNDPISPADGWRVLICRYRPRALKKADETWHTWYSQLGPSIKLHAAAYGKHGAQPIAFPDYKKKYIKEMQKTNSADLIVCLAQVLASGGTVTLLCSSACMNEEKCHRSILRELIFSVRNERLLPCEISGPLILDLRR